MYTLRIKSERGPYDACIGQGLIRHMRALVRSSGLRGPLFLVTQEKVRRALRADWPDQVKGFDLPDGERAKSMAAVHRMVTAMMEAGISRDGVVVAIGGGTVGDVAGFVASIYMRGVAVVQVPTTLLAQVDSSIGGKTAVNHPRVKNLIGTFHPPRLVLMDSNALNTLSSRHFANGLFEALKYGLISDRSLFDRFSERFQEIADRNSKAVGDLVAACARAKAAIVSKDEREHGLRRILNFGHTIGHGIESAYGYRRILHGEAVGYGMLVATRLSKELRMLPQADVHRIETTIREISRQVRRLPNLKGLDVNAVLSAVALDKKVRDGKLHFVLLRRIGGAEVRSDVPVTLLRRVVRGVIDEHQT